MIRNIFLQTHCSLLTQPIYLINSFILLLPQTLTLNVATKHLALLKKELSVQIAMQFNLFPPVIFQIKT